jgi:hypothetical protein
MDHGGALLGADGRGGDAVRDVHTDGDADSDADEYPNRHAYAHADIHAHGHAYKYPDGDAHADAYEHPDSDTNSDPDRDADRHTDLDANNDTDRHTDLDAHQHANLDPNGDACAGRDGALLRFSRHVGDHQPGRDVGDYQGGRNGRGRDGGRMTRLIIALVMLPVIAAGQVTAPTCTGTVGEQTTGAVTITLCDGVGVQHATCTAAGLTGALVSAAHWTQLKYWVEDHATDCSLVAETTVDPDANPYAVSWTTAAGKIIGRCSSTTATCCAIDGDCPAGETCKIIGGARQYHNFTAQSQWTGGGQAVDTFVVCIDDEPDYP